MNNPFNTGAPETAISVSQLNRQVKTLLDSHFDSLWVEGEISNFVAPASGHWYFSLKDSKSQVRCAMFNRSNQRVRFTPANGDAVRVRCRASLYEARGEFQLIAEHLEPAGAGALQAAFEQLKGRLEAEGLFAQARKRALPTDVARVGVITSPSGAVIHDILQVLERRCPTIEVCVFPVAVQGEGAAQQIGRAIACANRWQDEKKVQLDALIVGRGGGSMEDLWAFNEEIVARAIAGSTLPIISAVGHEVDFTIADMAADVRAPTPSAAAEMISPDRQEWQQHLDSLHSDLVRRMKRRLLDTSTLVNHLARQLRHPGAQLRDNAQRIDDLELQLMRAQRNLLKRHGVRVKFAGSRLLAHSPDSRIIRSGEANRRDSLRLKDLMLQRLRQRTVRIAALGQMLDSLSPLGTLQRGYAIVTDNEGLVVRDARQVSAGDKLQAQLASGRLDLTVNESK
ncbi:exodeoxyribonuclease VII large subunit [Candidatus Marimicrobium litorale]|uniref:exodeoxyribonuclease VII large subunit n=1 Tax=Candidatus Marimicrobium litorale TaxID=2518991 RepID=UPI0024315737|nr:exodeoxyribonuclease VII large subunit [Candidatus Marimicrobium litorale]